MSPSEQNRCSVSVRCSRVCHGRPPWWARAGGFTLAICASLTYYMYVNDICQRSVET